MVHCDGRRQGSVSLLAKTCQPELVVRGHLGMACNGWAMVPAVMQGALHAASEALPLS